MKLMCWILWLSFACTITGSVSMAGEIMSVKDYLKSSLDGSEKISKEDFSLSDKQKEGLLQLAPKAQESSLTFFYGRGSDGQMKVACTVVAQQGKEGPMTVGICFESDGRIKKVTILNFVEERGQPIKEKGFLGQFAGKPLTNTFQVGKDVDGVTGATQSSKAVSEAVRKASFGFREFILSKEKSKEKK